MTPHRRLVSLLLPALFVALANPAVRSEEPESCEVPADATSEHCARCTEPCRTVRFSFVARLDGLPAGAREAVLFLPLPANSPNQTIEDLAFETAGAVETVSDDRHGNPIARIVFSGKALETPSVTVRFRAHRQAVRVDLAFLEGTPDPRSASREAAPHLSADPRTPANDGIKALVARLTEGKVGAVARGRALFQHVVTEIAPVAAGEAGGGGRAEWALEHKRGDAADVHALFIALARAAGIPARFETGVLLQAHTTQGSVAGRHVWASMFVPILGWVPVDAAEAKRQAGRPANAFGGVDCDRILFSSGSDLTCGQAGAPWDFLLEPRAEADGVPLPAVGHTLTFQEEARDEQ